MVRDDPKLLEDNGKIPKPIGVVGGSIPSRDIVSVLDKKLTSRSNTSCVPKTQKPKNKNKT